MVRLADYDIAPGVVSEAVREGDEWPQIHAKILAADILILATPTWIGQPSSIIKRALERMDALLSETDAEGVPVAYNKVAGFVVTGNEDGAHHVIAEMAQGAIDYGFTVRGRRGRTGTRAPARARRSTSPPTRRSGRTAPARPQRRTSTRWPTPCRSTR